MEAQGLSRKADEDSSVIEVQERHYKERLHRIQVQGTDSDQELRERTNDPRRIRQLEAATQAR